MIAVTSYEPTGKLKDVLTGNFEKIQVTKKLGNKTPNYF